MEQIEILYFFYRQNDFMFTSNRPGTFSVHACVCLGGCKVQCVIHMELGADAPECAFAWFQRVREKLYRVQTGHISDIMFLYFQ